MKRITAVIPLMVCLAFSMMLLSCVEREDVAGPETGYTISGTVQYWRDQSAAAGVLVGLSGISKSETCITDSTGSFSFTDVEDGTYTILPIETAEIDCYFIPESKKVTVREEDITVFRFSALKYPRLILRNNSPKKIIGVRVSAYARPQVWSDNILSGDLAPFSGSEMIRLKSGTKLMEVTGVEGTLQFAEWIKVSYIAPGDTLVFPLSSLIKVANNSSKTLVRVTIDRDFSFPGLSMSMGSENLLKNWLTPGSVSENIYYWPGLSDFTLTYLENSDSNFVEIQNIDITPGDTVYIPFEM